MNIVIQRVNNSRVEVNGRVTGQIDRGLLVFLGVAKTDTQKDADYLVRKIANLRIFRDDQGKMNCSALDVGAQFLVVSQFTIQGCCNKGRRPSFDKAADSEKGEDLYRYFVEELKKCNLKVETGEFGAMMDVHLINDGPVTFIIDSNREQENGLEVK